MMDGARVSPGTATDTRLGIPSGISGTNLTPLWLKFSLSLSVALIVVALVAGDLLRSQLQEDYAASLHDTSEEMFLLLTAATLEPVISEDIPQLRTLVNETGRLQPDVHAIRIFNEEGLLLASWTRNNNDATMNLVSFSKEIRFEEELFGSMAIEWSASRLDQQVERQVKRLRYSVFASLIVLTLIIILLIHAFAVRPIGRIHNRLLALTRGDLKSRLSIQSSRELALLGSSVNQLAESLELQRTREQELETAQQELFEAKEMAEITLHSIGDGVITTDVEGCVQYLNPISEQLTGWTSEEAKGRPIEQIFSLIDETSHQPIPNTVRQSLQSGKIVTMEKNALLIGRDGQESAIDDSGSPILNRHGEIVGAVMVFHDVTEARHMTHELEYQAAHDSLTGLINRNEFSRLLYQFRQDVNRKNRTHALLYIDLDQFKVVNDTCGHAAGDALLQQLSHLITDDLRRGDVFARLGGDEFGILLNECPVDIANEIADTIRRTVEQFRFVWEENTFSVGASIGIVSINLESAEAEILLRQADEACYSAKEHGRNRLHVFTEDDDNLNIRRNEMSWVSRVDSALTEDRFVLYQQSILPLNADNREPGQHIEILVRLVEPDGTIVPPGAFIPAVERYGLMSKIDRWVINHTFDWLRCNPEKMANTDLCNINLSGNSLSDNDLLHHIAELLDSPKIDARKICFELTETAAVSNLSLALHFMHHLKKRGCLFALDDFGSGMSSFGYLKNLPVDFLKIDGMFVRDITRDRMSLAMVTSINDIGHVMGKRTIAEFVENDETLQQLKLLGVDFAQGYGIAKPEPLESVASKKM